MHISISFPLNEIVTGDLTGGLPDAQFDQFFGIDSSILGGSLRAS